MTLWDNPYGIKTYGECKKNTNEQINSLFLNKFSGGYQS